LQNHRVSQVHCLLDSLPDNLLGNLHRSQLLNLVCSLLVIQAHILLPNLVNSHLLSLQVYRQDIRVFNQVVRLLVYQVVSPPPSQLLFQLQDRLPFQH
jgi:hypothetical protein